MDVYLSKFVVVVVDFEQVGFGEFVDAAPTMNRASLIQLSSLKIPMQEITLTKAISHCRLNLAELILHDR